MTTQIYLAGRWSRREELVAIAERLEAWHPYVRVHARWLTDPEHRAVLVLEEGAEAEEAERQRFNATLAGHDMDDVQDADVVILFTQPEQGARGGCWVEFGMALAWGTEVVLVGPQSNVFTYLPQVTVVPDVEALFAALQHEEIIL